MNKTSLKFMIVFGVLILLSLTVLFGAGYLNERQNVACVDDFGEEVLC